MSADFTDRYYLSGPMSGLPYFNFPTFGAVAALLRRKGLDIVSPHELDSPETRAMAMASPDGAHSGQGDSWGTCLARDVKIIADETKGMIFLPGWSKSRGARLEAFTALLSGHKFYIYDDAVEDIFEISAEDVREIIRSNMP